MKSFVQRRGRARSRDSKLIILLESANINSTPWEQIEKDMKTIYEDDMRQLRQYEVLEGSEKHDGRYFRVEKTGALLDLDNALSVSTFGSIKTHSFDGFNPYFSPFTPTFYQISNADALVFSTCIISAQPFRGRSMWISGQNSYAQKSEALSELL